VGTMNVFFKLDGEIVTPSLQGSILGGITRLSAIEMLRSWGYTVKERLVTLDEVAAGARDGRLEEAFGTGTAAVISPIGELKVDEERLTINRGEIGPVARRLYDTLTDIQNCRIPDPFGWVVRIGQ
ncbi:MAG: branched chain amino acid aminotransferase, partial [Clostridiales bacterium]|nr:branched chain amino acid aminotransferase [Clostridiales bacterium]